MLRVENVFSQAIPGAFGIDFLRRLIAASPSNMNNTNELKLEHTDPDQTYGVGALAEAVAQTEPAYDYFEVEVEKVATTNVYIRMAKGTDFNKLPYAERAAIIKEAVADTVGPYDWDDNHNDYDQGSVRKVSEDEATEFDVFEHA